MLEVPIVNGVKMNTDVKTNQGSSANRRTEGLPRLLEWFEDFPPLDLVWRNIQAHPIKIEEFEKDGNLVIRAEMPGVDPDKDIDVTTGDGFLTIKGERKEEHKDAQRSEFYYGSFMRTIPLPKGVDEKNVKAEYRDGILEVQIAFPPAPSTAKRVPISRANGK